jgi:cell division protein FtsI (penicillin-binding protein 3)
VYVVVENPRGQSVYGSQIAAPIFRDVATGLMDSVGIARAGTQTSAGGQLPAASPGASPVAAVGPGSVMPDLRGTPKKLLLPLLLRQDIEVSIHGSGYVASQDPPPGTRVQPGMKIDLELK